jgi:hypothetical protein
MKMIPYQLLFRLLSFIGLFFLGSCSVAPPTTATTSSPAAEAQSGLATQWGETRTSYVTTHSFVRENSQVPTITTALFYNNEIGIMAMTQIYQQQPTAQLMMVARGLIGFGLQGEDGQLLAGLTLNGQRYVIGEPGQRYSIIVTNNSAYRLEAVLSVDGLDVLDGRRASFAKRGYLIAPHSTLEVDGFRQSSDAVAAFRFGTIQESYAYRKHGDIRNVGVIGLALFHERGTSLFDSAEIEQRRTANPFPGEFATPP